MPVNNQLPLETQQRRALDNLCKRIFKCNLIRLTKTYHLFIMLTSLLLYSKSTNGVKNVSINLSISIIRKLIEHIKRVLYCFYLTSDGIRSLVINISIEWFILLVDNSLIVQ